MVVLINFKFVDEFGEKMKSFLEKALRYDF